MDTLPQDTAMLLSTLNMRLRDSDADLDDICASFGTTRKDVEARLADAGFVYDEAVRRFW